MIITDEQLKKIELADLVTETEYPYFRAIVENELKQLWLVYKYSDLTKELIIDIATRSYKRTSRWRLYPKR